MSRSLCVLAVAVLLVSTPASGEQKELAKPSRDKPNVERMLVRGEWRFPEDKLVRISGRMTVQNAHVLRYEDGTEVDLLGALDAPDLEQQALSGDDLYPCGKEAAEFVRKLIGDRPVTCFIPTDRDDWKEQTKYRQGNAFVEEKSINAELVRNGWAMAHHSGTAAWEAIARENNRGLWRGRFVFPDRWRKGERLPDEQ